MCTSIAMKTTDFYFGRNLDLHYPFGGCVITPRNYAFPFEKGDGKGYALIGTATVLDGYPLYAEAANEKGLAMAGLNFPKNAYYPSEAGKGKRGVSPFEFIPFLLRQCATVKEAERLLKTVDLIDKPFRADVPLTPLHWHIADKSGSLVVERAKQGFFVYKNPFGALTNAPSFPYHTQNYPLYRHLSAKPTKDRLGLNAIGLLGDYSSPSRFVKAAWLLERTPKNLRGEQAIAHFFKLLAAVAPVKGSVKTKDGQEHFTQYACCINCLTGVYYRQNYDELSPRVFSLFDADLSATELFCF